MKISSIFNEKSKKEPEKKHNPATCDIDCYDCNLTSMENIRRGKQKDKENGYQRLSKERTIELKTRMSTERFEILNHRMSSQKSHKKTEDKINKVSKNCELIEIQMKEIELNKKLNSIMKKEKIRKKLLAEKEKFKEKLRPETNYGVYQTLRYNEFTKKNYVTNGRGFREDDVLQYFAYPQSQGTDFRKKS